jgi:hydroxymethylpyrimidine kinase/phosphomethylpyrimidine kinase
MFISLCYAADIAKVMVATSGARLLKEEAIKTLCTELLPLVGLITPNIPEALLLLEESGNKIDDIKDLDGMKQLAKAVAALGPKSVLIKGGHIPLKKNYEIATTDEEKEVLVNVLFTDGDFCVFESKYQIARNTHGTGCSLACMCHVFLQIEKELTCTQLQSLAMSLMVSVWSEQYAQLVATSRLVSRLASILVKALARSTTFIPSTSCPSHRKSTL